MKDEQIHIDGENNQQIPNLSTFDENTQQMLQGILDTNKKLLDKLEATSEGEKERINNLTPEQQAKEDNDNKIKSYLDNIITTKAKDGEIVTSDNIKTLIESEMLNIKKGTLEDSVKTMFGQSINDLTTSEAFTKLKDTKVSKYGDETVNDKFNEAIKSNDRDTIFKILQEVTPQVTINSINTQQSFIQTPNKDETLGVFDFSKLK